jgi:hypothetical protein
VDGASTRIRKIAEAHHNVLVIIFCISEAFKYAFAICRSLTSPPAKRRTYETFQCNSETLSYVVRLTLDVNANAYSFVLI